MLFKLIGFRNQIAKGNPMNGDENKFFIRFSILWTHNNVNAVYIETRKVNDRLVIASDIRNKMFSCECDENGFIPKENFVNSLRQIATAIEEDDGLTKYTPIDDQ